jgi:thiol-disulfide isomerase/thioredoxin
MKKRTFINILIILVVLAFFVTPLGHYGKVTLNKVLSFSPKIIPENEREVLTDYHWKLKDENWAFFDFNQSKGKVVFVNFWASWRMPCEVELASVQKLYDEYQGKIDFYIITDELQEPVDEFMQKHEFDFPVTYLIIGEKAPFSVLEPPASYLIDKKGGIVVKKEGIAKWHGQKVQKTLDQLLAE